MKLDITPMGAPRQTQRDRWAKRPVIMRYHAYRDELNLKLPGFELGMSLDLRFYLPMPATWSKKKKTLMLGKYHDQKPDIDNLAKAFMDAFKVEDKHVAVLHCEKYWSNEGGIEIL